ncbi:hypothetical protein [Mucilaginibacter sp. UYCu711]|uniref:hypothetical protein n=1 Tax=Mucilaginibacter sp. UYCu711 TaxID=3156339 RepID=UPI003D1BC6E4
MAMILAFKIVGSGTMFTLVMVGFIALWLLFINAVGQYGKDTALGYWGTILLAVLSTPITALIIVAIVRSRTPPPDPKY